MSTQQLEHLMLDLQALHNKYDDIDSIDFYKAIFDEADYKLAFLDCDYSCDLNAVLCPSQPL